jgi:hypothetical protein
MGLVGLRGLPGTRGPKGFRGDPGREGLTGLRGNKGARGDIVSQNCFFNNHTKKNIVNDAKKLLKVIFLFQ